MAIDSIHSRPPPHIGTRANRDAAVDGAHARSAPNEVSNKGWSTTPPIDYIDGVSKSCLDRKMQLVSVGASRFTQAPKLEPVRPLVDPAAKRAAVQAWLTASAACNEISPDYLESESAPHGVPVQAHHAAHLPAKPSIPVKSYRLHFNNDVVVHLAEAPEGIKGASPLLRHEQLTPAGLEKQTAGKLKARFRSDAPKETAKSTARRLLEQFRKEGSDVNYWPSEKSAFWNAALTVPETRKRAQAAVLQSATATRFVEGTDPLPSMKVLAKILGSR